MRRKEKIISNGKACRWQPRSVSRRVYHGTGSTASGSRVVSSQGSHASANGPDSAKQRRLCSSSRSPRRTSVDGCRCVGRTTTRAALLPRELLRILTNDELASCLPFSVASRSGFGGRGRLNRSRSPVGSLLHCMRSSSDVESGGSDHHCLHGHLGKLSTHRTGAIHGPRRLQPAESTLVLTATTDVSRKPDGELGAATQSLAGCLHGPSVKLHQMLHDRQPQPQPAMAPTA